MPNHINLFREIKFGATVSYRLQKLISIWFDFFCHFRNKFQTSQLWQNSVDLESSKNQISSLLIFYSSSMKMDDFRKWGWISNVFELSFRHKSCEGSEDPDSSSPPDFFPDLYRERVRILLWVVNCKISLFQTKPDFSEIFQVFSEIFHQIVLMRAGLEASTQLSFASFNWVAPVYWETQRKLFSRSSVV